MPSFTSLSGKILGGIGLKLPVITRGVLTNTLNNPEYLGNSQTGVFGGAVAISGDRAIIGAQGEALEGQNSGGAVFIIDIKTGQIIHSIPNVNAFSTGAGDAFGRAVDIDGNLAIVGAPLEDVSLGGTTRLASGYAYIINVTTGAVLRNINNYNTFGQPELDNFGSDVGISGDRAIIGAPGEGEDGQLVNPGRAYIVNATTGARLYTLNGSGNGYGEAVAISGNYAAVGGSGTSAHVEENVYIYNVSTGALLRTLNFVGDARFGAALAIDGDRLIVGAPQYDDGAITSTGRAYIYDITNGQLLQTLDNPNAYSTPNSDQFGYAVDISGNRCVVGARFEDDADGTSSGKAYVFNVATGEPLHILNNPNAFGTSASDQFGSAVAIEGNYILVGAPAEDAEGNPVGAGGSSGKAYIFR